MKNMKRVRKTDSISVKESLLRKGEPRKIQGKSSIQRPTSPRGDSRSRAVKSVSPESTEDFPLLLPQHQQPLPPATSSTSSQDSGRSTDGGSSARSGISLEVAAATVNAGGIGGTGDWSALMTSSMSSSSIQAALFKTPSIGKSGNMYVYNIYIPVCIHYRICIRI